MVQPLSAYQCDCRNMSSVRFENDSKSGQPVYDVDIAASRVESTNWFGVLYRVAIFCVCNQ